MKALLPRRAGLPLRLTARAAIGGIGVALANLPDRDDRALWRAGAKSAGQVLAAVSASGALYDVSNTLKHRYRRGRTAQPVLGAIGISAAFAIWGRRNLEHRKSVIPRWPIEQKNDFPMALGVGYAVYAFGAGLGKAYIGSRKALVGYLGPGPSKRAIGGIANAALWTAGAVTAYNAGVGYIGRSNENIEPAYAMPPVSPLQIAQVHSEQHLRPVLGIDASGTGMDGDDGRPVVVRPEEEGLTLEPGHRGSKAGQLRPRLVQALLVTFLNTELDQHLGVVERPGDIRNLLDDSLVAGQTSGNFQRPIPVRPQIRDGSLFLQLGELGFLAGNVKGTSARRRGANGGRRARRGGLPVPWSGSVPRSIPFSPPPPALSPTTSGHRMSADSSLPIMLFSHWAPLVRLPWSGTPASTLSFPVLASSRCVPR